MKCQDCDETQDTTACYLPGIKDAPSAYYCDQHAAAHGFCCGCGQFWAGVESFEFSRFHGGFEGLCEDCSDELKDELTVDHEDYHQNPLSAW